jgi:AcrR family transcriptional regulator
MTMRDLSQASGLSMGALYSYFSSKEELLEMVQATGRKVTGRLLAQGVEGVDDPVERLTAAVRTHVFLSEAMQPWFFFSYMEARHLGERQKELAKEGELATERLYADIIREGARRGLFVERDAHLTAALIKAMLQDWYLKRWKHAGRRVSADRYAQEVVGMTLAYCLGAPACAPAGQHKDEKP